MRSRTGNAASMLGSNPPLTQIGFLTTTRVATGGTTFSDFPAVLGDFTGSGKKLDVATVVNAGTGSHPQNQISVALSNGDGTFTTKVTNANKDPNPDPIWVGDLNGDGKDDILLVHQATALAAATVDVYIGNGDGTFKFNGNTAITVANDDVVWAAVADVTGDKKLDFVVADAASPGNIWTLAGNGNGTFQAATSVAFTGQLSQGLAASEYFNPMVFADLNNDGKLDFAAASASNNQIMVYLASGSGYLPPVPLTTPTSVYDSCFLASGDLTGDGVDELVSANCVDNTVTVYVNDGSGTFQTGVYYPASGSLSPAWPVALTIADVDGDGKNDIVLTDQQGGDVTVLLGNGNGTVQNPSVGYAVGGWPHTPALVADFNQDGHADVIVPDYVYSLAYLQGYGDGSFRSAVNYYAEPIVPPNGQPYSVGIATGDFNRDGNPDFVIGNANFEGTPPTANGVTVFLSNPDGSLQPGVNYNSSSAPFELEYVAVADFDGDGKLDIAATDALNGVVQIFTGKGDGTFDVGATYPTGTLANRSALGLVAGDFNGDGKPDLAVVNNYGTPASSADVAILLNKGSGVFSAPTNFALSKVATEISAADLNGDKKLDLVIPLYGTSGTPGTAVAVLLGNGDGKFQAEKDRSLVDSTSTTYYNPYAAALGDLNGDGKMDLAVTVDGGVNEGIVVALGKGDGTFQTPTFIPSSLQPPDAGPPIPAYIRMFDLDRDGHLDLVYTNAKYGTLGVMYGKGDGTFYDPLEFPAGHYAYDIALADLNRDGAVDVVTSGNGEDFSGVTVLLNTSADSIQASSSPNPAEAGTKITFTAEVTGSKVRGVSAIPTGSVTFLEGSTVLGLANLDSSGQAALGVTTLAAGSHSITAQYNGDVNYLKVSSSALNQVVTPVPDYGLTAKPTSASVSPGGSASFTITLTPSNGYNGTVTLSCPSQLPPGVSCQLPSPLAPPYKPATLTITTTGPTASLIVPPELKQRHGESNLWASLGEMGVLGLVLVGDWKKHNRRRIMIALGIVASILLLGLVGCGGGGGSSSGGGGTPAGNYQIQITATGTAGTTHGNTSPHQLTLMLTVTQ